MTSVMPACIPVVRLTSSAPEWPAVGRGVALDPGIGHFSKSSGAGVGELRVGACHFCAAGRLEHTVRGGPGGV